MKQIYHLTAILLLIISSSSSVFSQTAEDRILTAETGLKVFFSSTEYQEGLDRNYAANPLEFRMRNSRVLSAFTVEVIDNYVEGNFDFDTVEQYFWNFMGTRNDIVLPVLPADTMTFVTQKQPDWYVPKVANGPCVNMDFEEGTMNGWEMYEGSVNNNPAEITNINQIFTPGAHHTMMAPGVDPVVGIPTTNPNGGNFSLRLGDGTGSGSRAASIKQTFLVDASNAVFTYSYAVVLQDPAGHTLGQKPFFKVNMYNQSGTIIGCGEYQVVAGAGLGADWISYGGGWYKDWETVFAPLDAYIGQNVTIEFISGDCNQGGHYGYAYIDAECSPLEIIPPGTLICDGNPVTLSAPAGAISYDWNTGATTQSISTAVAGTYSVDVVPVQGATCAVTMTATVNQSNGAPTAGFTAQPMQICEGESITFTDQSTATFGSAVDYWDYNFGDGSMNASVPNTSHEYTTAGTYDVQFVAGVLVPGQGGCFDTLVQTVEVSPSPVADFTTVPVCLGAATSFTDISTDVTGISGWNWDFDSNGSFESSAQNPTNLYTTSGNHTATLVVTSTNGCKDTIVQPLVVNPLPVASFTQVDVCDTDVMSFTDGSTSSGAAIDTWTWNFGDASGTSALQSPTYTYGSPGTYNVMLTVETTDGCTDNTTVPVDVYINPTASFVVDNVCDEENYVLMDNSNGNGGVIDTWEWDYTNDGTVDFTGQNGNNLYPSAGTYDVNLTVTTSDGCTGETTQTVTVFDLPVPSFTVAQECQGVSTQFTDGSTTASGTITAWEWDFTNNGSVDNTQQNPSQVLGAAGGYTTSLTVTTSNGCVASTTGPVIVDPLPVAEFSWTDVCEATVMNFTDQSTVATGSISTYQWDFGDLTGNSNIQNAAYTYANPGQYNVVLVVTSDQGCIGSANHMVEMFPNPSVNFTFNNRCLGLPTNLSSTTNIFGASSATYNWDFTTNGSTDYSGTSTDHMYAVDGSYDVTLSVITADGCTGQLTQEVIVYPLPQPAFTGQNVCEDNTVSFTNSSSVNSGSITNHFWDFANGGTSTQSDPTELYDDEGVYMVSLTNTTDHGCEATITQPIEIYPTPVPQFVTNDVCDGSMVNFTNFSTVSNQFTNNSVVAWDWDFGTTPASGTQGQFASTIYPAPGTYTVTLDVTTNNGCTDSYQSTVTVYPNPVVSFVSPNPDGCTEWCPTINNTSSIASGTNSAYFWNLGDGTASTDENPVHCFNNTTLSTQTYDVTLTVTSDFGCTTTVTENAFITVYPTPVAEFSFDPVIGDIYDPTTNFYNESLIADTYAWNFANLGTSQEESPTFRFPDADSGTYTVCLHVETIHGCENDICHDVVINGYSNIYVPNAFTPDGDGINDTFKPSMYGFSEKDYSFMVFDRWGLLIYSTNNQQNSWDGTYKGQQCSEDAYVWKVKAVDKYTGEDVSYLGHITLLR